VLSLGVKDNEIVQITDGDEQILIFCKRQGSFVRLKIHADKRWRIHRGTIEEAKKEKQTSE